jgi:hypothetical protein
MSDMNRQELYGTNIGWYMQDAEGAIALFLSGYGPIPSVVFSDPDGYRQLDTAVGTLQICPTHTIR